MPRHSFKCETHGLFDFTQPLNMVRELEECPVCHILSRKTFETFSSEKGGGIRVFQPRWFEHISPEPIFINSKKELKEVCEREGKYSQYVEDSFNRSF